MPKNIPVEYKREGEPIGLALSNRLATLTTWADLVLATERAALRTYFDRATDFRQRAREATDPAFKGTLEELARVYDILTRETSDRLAKWETAAKIGGLPL